MKTIKLLPVLVIFSLLALRVSATVRYVDLNSANSTPPFTDWSTAATNIQDAIDVAIDGDQILVTNGVYQSGGKAMAGDLTNRIALDKAVIVQSVSGPWVTSIQGGSMTNGTASVRCAWLTNGAVLIGFGLQGGGTRKTGDTTSLQSGGGIWCASSNAIIANSIIYSNTAASQGGGVYQGTLKNCAIYGNTSSAFGGGTYNSILNNCTVVNNSGNGGVYLGRLTNCIIYNNSIANYINVSGAFSYCCTYPLPAGGTGNFTNNPQLFVDNIHFLTNSPCIGSGTNSASGTDIDGQSWANPPSIGCSEWRPIPFINQPKIQLTSDPVGFGANAAITGVGNLTNWWLKDGVPLQDNDHFSFTQTTNLVATGVSFTDAGNYQLVVSNASGVVTSSVAQLVIHCVDVAGINPVTPYSNWTTAATNIQDAITASAPGDVVLVTNGLYATGGKSMDAMITNRISVDKAILVQSVNGPNATIIQGAWDPTSTNGPGAVRCAWLTNSAILNGFTLRGGATRSLIASPNQTMEGGGIYGSSTSATVNNCLIATNYASYIGGGAFQATLNQCTLAGNHARGSGTAGSGLANAGSGGGAANCNLKNCFITANFADQSNGGGSQNCNATNCAFTKNRAYLYGSGNYQGSLVGCTVANNTSGGYGAAGGAVASTTLTDCIVYGNINIGAGSTNYVSCTFSFSDTDPLPSGTGNIDVDPQLLPDGIHLSATSLCLGAGSASVVSGTDIDGQPWNNPPAIGCDEWQPAPMISTPLVYQVNSPAHGLTFNVIAAGQSPFTFLWSKDGVAIQDDGHHSNSGTANLVVNNFNPADSGFYQIVVSNAFGVATSQVAQVVIHAVDASGINPVAPYSSWATAATTIQDAINLASAGDIVLVTNGIYAAGGKALDGDLTNRVAVDKAITVMSVNGYATTVVQGAWDPVSTNGPGAVRCAYLADGAVLSGFTLQNGATLASAGFIGNPPESGGGVRCNSTGGIVANCVLSNNSAIYGGGISYGTLNNSLVINNVAARGGGAYSATLNNCTVVNNFATTPSPGAGTYAGITRNSIVIGNYDNWPFPYSAEDNYGSTALANYTYSCTSPTKSGTGNSNVDPQFLDLFHIASTSPCFGAGSAAYNTGTDLDGEPWDNPPSMGCDEVVLSNLVGPLAVNIQAYQTNLLVNRYGGFTGIMTGHVARVEWSFGDGPIITNSGADISHRWVNPGDYSIIFTAYNNDNPAGVSTNIVIHVEPLNAPELQSTVLLTNGFQFQFIAQTTADYTIQFATNLVPPVVWNTLQTIYHSSGGLLQITDPAAPIGTRFYRVLAQ